MGKATVTDNHPASCGHIVLTVDNETHVFTKDDLDNKSLNRPQWLKKIQKLTDGKNLKTTDVVRKFLKDKDIK